MTILWLLLFPELISILCLSVFLVVLSLSFRLVSPMSSITFIAIALLLVSYISLFWKIQTLLLTGLFVQLIHCLIWVRFTLWIRVRIQVIVLMAPLSLMRVSRFRVTAWGLAQMVGWWLLVKIVSLSDLCLASDRFLFVSFISNIMCNLF